MAALSRCQQQAEELTELMRLNVAKALEREERLGELGGRAEELSAMGSQFRRSTRVVSRQQRSRRGWGAPRLRWVLVGVGAALLVLLIGLGLGLGLRWAAPTAAQRPTATTGTTQHS
ncbi:vesicle-associated membrane protein 5-like [Excalfactoria chinensis]|uniref:vesicle-associated membrane protein 5-like n=1 Tax=Excalfactoria chinensis TaxID=46218 RepID=UPI003B3AE351